MAANCRIPVIEGKTQKGIYIKVVTLSIPWRRSGMIWEYFPFQPRPSGCRASGFHSWPAIIPPCP